MDMALIAQAATLESRVPILHFFDGFRTSHEVAKIEQVPVEVVREMIDDELVFAHRARALSPDHPVIRGTAQNPDVYFQARETVNPFYDRMPEIVQRTMDKFAGLTGRQYHLFEYVGAPDAERVMVLMGSGAEAAEETVDHLNAHGEKVGLVKVRLYRPFAADELLKIIPATARRIAVLDRTKEPGADGEPLYKDVVTAIAEACTAGVCKFAAMPRVVGGRYGLSSKEFTPGMIKGVFDELKKDQPKNHFTVGIIDDVTHTSLDWDADFRIDAGHGVMRCMFYGLGSDGTVGANKNTIKIMGEETELYGQGYFVYDSKKAGAVTISHLRFSPKPIHSPYLIGDNEANFVGCHQPVFLERYDMLRCGCRRRGVPAQLAGSRRTRCGTLLTRKMQQQIIDKKLRILRHRRLRHRQGDRHGQPHQHHHADLLLRHFRRAAARRGDREDQARRRKILQQERQGGGRSQLEGDRRNPRQPAQGGSAEAGHQHSRDAGDRAGLMRPSSCARSLPRSWPAAATGCRSARCPTTAPGPPARRNGTSATWRRKSRCGTRSCASTAASARSSARTPPSAPRCSRPTWPRTRRPPSSTSRSRARNSSRACTSATRSRRKIAPAAACAWISARR